jgi:uncharacterized protein YjiS (DUF1127 family)
MAIFDAIFRAFQINRTASALNRLSDVQLKDIGLRREQIGAHSRGIFADGWSNR